jgi:UDP-glucuronate decarboxylase
MHDLVPAFDIAEICDRLESDAYRLSGKTILLTGARGFLGRYFLEVFRQLNETVLAEPVRVIALDNLITGTEMAAEIPFVRFIEHDVTRPLEVTEPIDFVIHAAGIASPTYYRQYPLETMDVAIAGTRRMLDLAVRKQARFTFFSSSEIYGDPDARHVPTSETYRGHVACQGPRACYDESKRVGETLCYVYHSHLGVHTNVIRPFNVYGPGMMKKDFRVLPNFAGRIIDGQPLSIYGSGNQTRTFCYITDAIVGFLLVALKGEAGEAYNIGTSTPEVSMLELVGAIERVLGRTVAKEVVDYPSNYPGDEPNRRCPDLGKALLHLGYEPQVDLDEGLKRFLVWAFENFDGAEQKMRRRPMPKLDERPTVSL